MLNRKLFLVVGLLILTGAACSPAPALTQSVEQLDVSEASTLVIQVFQTPTLDPFVLGEHHVASGETLACIGRGYHVLPEAIARFNRIDQAAELQTGQVLKIPAISWANMPDGPVCPPQFIAMNWDMGATKQAQSVTMPTERSPSIHTATMQATIERTATKQIQSVKTPTKSIKVKTPLVFDDPTAADSPAIQVIPGATNPPIQCCPTCLVACTELPPIIIELPSETPQPPPPAATSVIIITPINPPGPPMPTFTLP